MFRNDSRVLECLTPGHSKTQVFLGESNVNKGIQCFGMTHLDSGLFQGMLVSKLFKQYITNKRVEALHVHGSKEKT